MLPYRLFGLVLLLAGCSNSNVNEALARAKAETNPVKALEIIQQAEGDYCEDKSPKFCFAPDELSKAEDDYFTSAARLGDERTLRILFSSGRGGKWLSLQDELKSSVLERAKSSKNPDLLATAAYIYGDGTSNVVNSTEKIYYLMRAWEAGDDQSAAQLAHHFVRLKDYEKAYFWSLRCNRNCTRDRVEIGEYVNQIELLELEKHLSSDKITKLQKEAAASQSSKG